MGGPSKTRDHRWVSTQLAAMKKRLDEELVEYGAPADPQETDENKPIRHRIYQERGLVEKVFDEISELKNV